MSYDDDEVGVETSEPRELFEYIMGTTAYRLSSGQQDVVLAGHTFLAQPSSRMEISIDVVTASVQFEAVLSIDHPLVTRYLAYGGTAPPDSVALNVYRVQPSGVEILWSGSITSMAIEGNEAKFLCPSTISRSMERTLPTIVVDTDCQNILYDGWCGIDIDAFTVDALASFVDGRQVNVNYVGGKPDGWFDNGAIRHVASGQLLTVAQQTGLKIIMSGPIVGLKAGDAVKLYAGCDHTIATCQSKFNNRNNYSGLPQRPTKNIFLPTGLGVLEYR